MNHSRQSRLDAHPPPEINVAIDHLTVDGVTLFRDLHLHLPAGKWTSLLGRSGSGKTTLLRVICGLHDASPPGLELRASNAVDPARQSAWMAQEDLLLPWCSALDNVLLGARLRGGAKPDVDRAQRLLDRVGLRNDYDKLPHALSGGMRQRVALARTLLEDKPVCLLDEPFSSVDAITRHQLQNLAFDLLREKTVLLVTHDPAEALRLSDTVHVLSARHGRLLEPIQPNGAPLRDPGDSRFARLTSQLLARLSDDD